MHQLSTKLNVHGDGGQLFENNDVISTCYDVAVSKKDIFGRVINTRPAIILVNSRNGKLRTPLPHFNDEKMVRFGVQQFGELGVGCLSTMMG